MGGIAAALSNPNSGYYNSDKPSKHITKALNKTGKLNIEASGEYKF